MLLLCRVAWPVGLRLLERQLLQVGDQAARRCGVVLRVVRHVDAAVCALGHAEAHQLLPTGGRARLA